MLKTPVDEDGQPLNRFFNAARVEGRIMNELLGVIRGVLADGTTNTLEAEYLDRWLKTNYEISCQWPANVIAQHLRQIFADGRVDEDERDSLQSLLGEIVGTQADYYAASTTSLPSRTRRVMFYAK